MASESVWADFTSRTGKGVPSCEQQREGQGERREDWPRKAGQVGGDGAPWGLGAPTPTAEPGASEGSFSLLQRALPFKGWSSLDSRSCYSPAGTGR